MLLPTATSKPFLPNVIAVFLHLSARLLLVCACVVTALQFVAAQEPATDDEVLKVNSDLFVFPIRIKDKRGTGAQITESDLSVTDKDHVTTGLYLYRGADRVALLFALDESGSVRDVISQQRDAALALFQRFGERSKVAVIRFAEKPLLVSEFGRDTSATSGAFSFPVRPNQHTAIFDAAAAALNAFDTLPRFRSERRIVVLISDGLDNASSTKAAQVVSAAIAKHVSFYIVHIPLFEPRAGRLVVRASAKGFRDLAERTGGKYFLVGDARSALVNQAVRSVSDLTPVFQSIEEDLRSQYLLGYYAGEDSRDGRVHQLKISFPAGVEYQITGFGYARTHEFVVKMPANAPLQNQ